MKLSTEDLKQMYSEMTNAELCEKLGITNVTLISLLKRANIKLKGKGNKTGRPKKINLTF